MSPEDEAALDMLLADAVVPCGSCHACCHSPVEVRPDWGDDPADYRLAISVDKSAPNKHAMVTLHRTADGTCYALRNGRCSIWSKRPRVCRGFDCRKVFLLYTKDERRELVDKGYFKKAVLQAGRNRAATLEDADVIVAAARRLNYGRRSIDFMEKRRGVEVKP
jgi:hypothetical protein